MRVALYLRYSTELQNPLSLRDQEHACRLYAQRQPNWHIADVFSDAAVSGRDNHRPGLDQLERALEAGSVDIVLVYDLSRLSRRMSVATAFLERLHFRRARLYTTKEGEITPILVGALSMAAQMQAEAVGSDSKRGQSARRRDHKWTGKVPYGYRLIDAAGGGKTLEVLPDEAVIVIRICEAFVAGTSPEAIAAGLNAEGIRGPGSRPWQNTTIRGQRDRGTGILNNPVYAGEAVYNRCSYVKNPKTDKRTARPHPPELWERTPVSAWRIVDDDLWAAVKTRQSSIRLGMSAAQQTCGNGLNGARRHKYLLSGKLSCGCCGGGYTIINRTEYGCAAHKAKGRAICAQTIRVKKQDVERRVMHAIEAELMSRPYVDAFVAEARAAYEQTVKARRRDRGKLASSIADREQRIERLIDQLEEGIGSPARIKERLAEHEVALVDLRRQLDSGDGEGDLIQALPALAEVYRERVAELVQALRDGGDAEAMEPIRRLIERIVVHADEGAGFRLELHGALAGILSLCANSNARLRGGRSGSVREVQVSVVAGVGFEPTTFRL